MAVAAFNGVEVLGLIVVGVLIAFTAVCVRRARRDPEEQPLAVRSLDHELSAMWEGDLAWPTGR